MSTGEFQRETPPVGEEIHLPGPSALPFLMSIGITMTVIGTTIAWWITGVGVAIFLYTAIRWIRDTRRDIDELPEQHSHPH